MDIDNYQSTRGLFSNLTNHIIRKIKHTRRHIDWGGVKSGSSPLLAVGLAPYRKWMIPAHLSTSGCQFYLGNSRAHTFIRLQAICACGYPLLFLLQRGRLSNGKWNE